MDRNLGDEKLATDGFQEAIDLLESLTLKSEASGLEQRVSCHHVSKERSTILYFVGLKVLIEVN